MSVAEPVIYASFLVRLWREPAADVAQGPAWMGERESTQTGCERTLLAVIAHPHVFGGMGASIELPEFYWPAVDGDSLAQITTSGRRRIGFDRL